MNDLFTMKMDNEMVRFTPDGRIAIVDAIRALSGKKDSTALWDSITTEKPEILKKCDLYPFGEEKPLVVVDIAGLDEIVLLLADHLLSRKDVKTSEGRSYDQSDV